MAKKTAKKTPRKKKPAPILKKKRIAKKFRKTTGKTKAIKGPAKRTATKTAVRKKPAGKKLLANVARKTATVAKTKKTVKPAGRKPNRPAARKPSIATAVHPAQSAAATHKPTPADTPQPAFALSAADDSNNQGADMAEGFQPGQRVRHRYEHWWGTIVRKADNASSTMTVPAPITYVVTVDGGQNRDDIRLEDLTVS